MDLKPIYLNVIEGQAAEVESGVKSALAAGVDAGKILNEALIAAMDEVGHRFEEGDFFVPEMLIAARAMQAGLALLRPHLASSDVKVAGKVAIGTVKGDLHDIGKNLVASMLEGGGFEIIDLGADVPPERFVEAVKEKGANIVALSALLTVTMTSMKTTIEALRSAGVREQVKVLVGGAPVTQQFADDIGADGYGDSATSAVSLARRLAASQ